MQFWNMSNPPTNDKPQPDDLMAIEGLQELMDQLKKAVNPNGTSPHLEGYVDSTFGYINNMLHKMNNAEDKDKAANDISNDLIGKMQKWADGLKAPEPEQKPQ